MIVPLFERVLRIGGQEYSWKLEARPERLSDGKEVSMYLLTNYINGIKVFGTYETSIKEDAIEQMLKKEDDVFQFYLKSMSD